jgi:hypothetical protein
MGHQFTMVCYMQFFMKSGANLETTYTWVTNAQIQYSKKLVKVVKEALIVFLLC